MREVIRCITCAQNAKKVRACAVCGHVLTRVDPECPFECGGGVVEREPEGAGRLFRTVSGYKNHLIRYHGAKPTDKVEVRRGQ